MPKKLRNYKGKPPAAPKSTKLPRKLPDDPIARGVAIMREATAEKPAIGKARPGKGAKP